LCEVDRLPGVEIHRPARHQHQEPVVREAPFDPVRIQPDERSDPIGRQSEHEVGVITAGILNIGDLWKEQNNNSCMDTISYDLNYVCKEYNHNNNKNKSELGLTEVYPLPYV
jgi:hypothetical protein